MLKWLFMATFRAPAETPNTIVLCCCYVDRRPTADLGGDHSRLQVIFVPRLHRSSDALNFTETGGVKLTWLEDASHDATAVSSNTTPIMQSSESFLEHRITHPLLLLPCTVLEG